jgi:hypothetical protein
MMATVAVLALLSAAPERLPRGPPFRESGFGRSVFRPPVGPPAATDTAVLRFLQAGGAGVTASQDICDALQATDRVGNWWCLRADGTTEPGSSATFSIHGSVNAANASPCPTGVTCGITSASTCPNGTNCSPTTFTRFWGGWPNGARYQSAAMASPTGNFSVCSLVRENFNQGGAEHTGVSHLAKRASGFTPDTDVALTMTTTGADKNSWAIVNRDNATSTNVQGSNNITQRAWHLHCATYSWKTSGTSVLVDYMDGVTAATDSAAVGPMQPATHAPWLIGSAIVLADDSTSDTARSDYRGAFMTESVLPAATIIALARAVHGTYANAKNPTARVAVSAANGFACENGTSGAGVHFVGKSIRPCVTARGLGAFSGATNSALWSESFDNAAWTKTNATVTANAAVSPDGLVRAETIATTLAGGFIESSAVAVSTSAASASVWVRSAAGSQVGTLLIRDTTAGADRCSASFTATVDWQRVIVRCEYPSLTSSNNHVMRLLPGGAGGGTIEAWGAQFDANAIGTATSYVYTEGTAVTASTAGYSLANPLSGASVPVWCLSVDVDAFWVRYGSGQDVWALNSSANVGGANSAYLYVAGNGTTKVATFGVYDSAAAQKQVASAVNFTASSGKHSIVACSSNGTLTLKVDGTPESPAPTGSGTGIISSMPTSLYFNLSSQSAAFQGYVSNVCLAPNLTGCP